MDYEESPFAHVTDPELLPEEERRRYQDYWASRTPGERLGEMMRLNRLKWGDEVFERGMDKTRFEVIDLSQYD